MRTCEDVYDYEKKTKETSPDEETTTETYLNSEKKHKQHQTCLAVVDDECGTSQLIIINYMCIKQLNKKKIMEIIQTL